MATDSPPTEPSPAATKYCPECGSRIDAEAERCPECGVAQESAEQQTASEPSSRILAAVVGGIVTFFVGWIPLVGPIPGGIVAGYLRGSDVTESTLTGLLANVLSSIPAVFLVVLFLFLGGLGAVMDGDGSAAIGLVLWLVIFALAFAYYYALGAFGGFLGAKITDRGVPDEE